MEIITGLLLSIIYSYLFLPKKEKEPPTISPTLYPIMFKGMIMLPISKKKMFSFTPLDNKFIYTYC